MAAPLPSPSSPPSDDPSPRTPRERQDAADHFVSGLVADMTAAWQRGERPLAEDFFSCHPHLWEDPEAAAELIYEEVCLRKKHGESVSTEAVLRRFPQWRAQLELLLDCERLFDLDQPLDLAGAEESAGEFRLLMELGRGGAGVVFLARQPALDDRPVVLKVTARAGREHLRLARLQHTHIVPLYAVEDDPERGLRILCMPYFGGTSLSRLLRALEPVPPQRRTGEDLVDALDQAQRTSPIALSERGPERQFLARASYVQAVCWIGSCLAGALHYAHQHGLVHLDLKPSNVLLTADGQPMLLDFHLAREPLAPGGTAPEGIGGTPGFMPPEQQLALAASRAGRPIPEAVDGRADVYSLGVLLYQALGGPSPVSSQAAQLLRGANPAVSPGLADILLRCLAPDPRRRYPDAAALAADLNRHLKDLPLKGVPNRSWLERWRKWRRRKPHALTLPLALTMVLAATMAGVIGHFHDQLGRARTALAEGQARLEQGRYAEAAQMLEQGLRVAQNVPGDLDLQEALREHLSRAGQAQESAEQTRLAAEFHRLVDRVRLLIGSDAPAVQTQRNLEASCRSLWEKREQLLARLAARDSRDEAVRRDLLDLALCWTDLAVALAPPDRKQAAHREALQVLSDAEAFLGPSLVLLYQREVHARAVGREDVARGAARRRSTLVPRTAWDHLALGRSFLEAGDLVQAAVHFDRARTLEPENVWANFYQGLCSCRRGDYLDAVAAFSVCIGLIPEPARCYFNRACAYEGCGEPERALRDYDRALQLEPGLGVAALNRGKLHYQLQRSQEALDDLHLALRGGVSPAVVYYHIALVKLAQNDRAGARDSIRLALEHDPANSDALKLRDSLNDPR
jgi:serine/threonine protein kinase